MAKLEEDFIIQEIDQEDRSILATHSDDINDWRLNYGLNLTWQSKLVDHFLINHIPKLHFFAPEEKHFVDISYRMDKTCQFFVLKCESADDLSCLSVECEEFAILCKRKNKTCGHKELLNRLCVPLVHRMSLHFIPCYNLVWFFENCVDQASWSCL